MPLSKKIRFEVFKRDGFTCQYCGNKPPSVVLEIDHINPRSNKGNDDINNLITACFDCNRGKSGRLLDNIPPSLIDNMEVLKEKENQIKEYNNFLKKISRRELKDSNEVDNIFSAMFPKYQLSDNFKKCSIKRFLKDLPKQEVIDSMITACQRGLDSTDTIKYFCGICWNKIKTKADPNYDSERKLLKYWTEQPRGSGYLPKGYIKKALNVFTEQEIMDAMDNAQGLWNELKEALDA